MLLRENSPERSDRGQELVCEVIGVIHRAVRARRDDPVCGNILQVGEKFLADRGIGIDLYERRVVENQDEYVAPPGLDR